MEPTKDSKLFVAAMKQLTAGMKAELFANNYANAGEQKDSSSIWQQDYNEGLKQFASLDQNKDGVIDDNEFKLVGTYVEIQQDKKNIEKYQPPSIEKMSGNNLIEKIFATSATKIENDTTSALPEKTSQSNSEIIPEKTSEIPKKSDKKISDNAQTIIAKAQENISNTQLKEQTNLKPTEIMTREEIIAEIQKYDENFSPSESTKTSLITKTLENFRLNNNLTDENSDIVDRHIGTFNQGSLGSCTLLSQLCGMSDDDMKKIIQEKSDDNGTYYEVTFPMDANDSSKKIRVSSDEILNNEIIVNYNGKDYPVSGFSSGDADVTLMEMAFIKRFGINGFAIGIDSKNTHNIFTYPDETKSESEQNITEEKLQSTTRATLQMKDYRLLDDSFSYLNRFTSQNNISVEWGLDSSQRKICEETLKNLGVDTSKYKELSDAEFLDETEKYLGDNYNFAGHLKLSNGIKLLENHAYAFKSYNPETKEVTIANPHKNNEDIVIPYDIAEKYLSISF